MNAMSDQKQRPCVRLELNAGVFRIPTDEVVFEITVAGRNGLGQMIEKIVEHETEPSQPSPPLPEPAEIGIDTFYKEISEEMYHEIGRLARQLSISIKTPLSESDLKNVDLGQAGVDLENAKGQLQDIVQMTEKATMAIMDVSEEIESSCDVIKKNLSILKSIQGFDEGGLRDEAESSPAGLFATLLQREQQLRDTVANMLRQPAREPLACEKKTVYRFSLDTVFQTLYELCTNETVKKNHIRPMREAQKTAFNEPAILQAFSDLAPTVPVEETFYQFPLSAILKILFQNCTQDSFRQTLKKMHQSAASIFLDQTLPIEGVAEEIEVPRQQPSAGDMMGSDTADIVRFIDETIDILRSGTERFVTTSDTAGLPVSNSESKAQLIDTIESTDAVLQRIIANIRRILEALTFQDLSGQRIKKILNMLSNVQVQLLSILVTFGVRLKKKQEDKDITAQETEEIASREINRIKTLVAEKPVEGKEWSGPLDQDAVDKLLAELGF